MIDQKAVETIVSVLKYWFDLSKPEGLPFLEFQVEPIALEVADRLGLLRCPAKRESAVQDSCTDVRLHG